MPRASVATLARDVSCPCCRRTLARAGEIKCPRCCTLVSLSGDFATDLVGDQLCIAFLWCPDGSIASSIIVQKEIWYNITRRNDLPEGRYPVFFVYNHIDPSKAYSDSCGCRVNKEPFLDAGAAIAIAMEHQGEALASGKWVHVEDLRLPSGQ